MDTQKADQLKGILEELLVLLGVSGKVEAGVADDGTAHLSISSDTPALLIGYHGKTLGALQTILNVIAYQKFKNTAKILIDVDGWRQRREETVTRLALWAAARAKETGTPQPIYNLTPYERRIVHIALSQDKDVKTESEGEGRERYIIVKLKSGN